MKGMEKQRKVYTKKTFPTEGHKTRRLTMSTTIESIPGLIPQVSITFTPSEA